MSEPLRVLVYGTLDAGACDFLRVGVHRGPLAERGVELRTWDEFADAVAGTAAGSAGLDGVLTPIDWADVIVFRRWRSTAPVCTECDAPFATPDMLGDHARAAGHRTLVPDQLLRLLVQLLVEHPAIVGDRAIVYEMDDDVLATPDWTGLGRAAARERDLILALLRRADLVTVATPVLATVARAAGAGTVRVVRNAIDPAWYEPPATATSAGEPPPAGDPRILYYGVPVRLRDYAICRPAVDALVAERPATRRIWLGAGHDPTIAALVDESRPYTDGTAAFAAALTAARPDIGLAPLRDEPFSRAKSELHWLEYTMAGAATIATRTPGPGPYDVIRDGVDGLLVADPVDWLPALRRLATSADLRAELAGRARDRVLADYTVARRADDWEAAYRWAAEHAGIGLGVA